MGQTYMLILACIVGMRFKDTRPGLYALLFVIRYFSCSKKTFPVHLFFWQLISTNKNIIKNLKTDEILLLFLKQEDHDGPISLT